MEFVLKNIGPFITLMIFLSGIIGGGIKLYIDYLGIKKQVSGNTETMNNFIIGSTRRDEHIENKIMLITEKRLNDTLSKVLEQEVRNNANNNKIEASMSKIDGKVELLVNNFNHQSKTVDAISNQLTKMQEDRVNDLKEQAKTKPRSRT